MDFSVKRVDVVNLFVEDLAGTRSFYQEVLGLTLAFEDEAVAVFKLENMIICLRDGSVEGADLIAPTTVAAPGGGSRFLLAVWVSDVDGACAELARRGVTLLNGPTNQPWGMRTACFADPAGHVWELAQDLG